MDLLTIGIVLTAWSAVAAALVAIVAIAGRADRRDERASVVEPARAQWGFSDSQQQARVGARRGRRSRRAAAEPRVRTGIRTAIH